MRTYAHNILKAASAAGLKLALCLVMLLLSVFSLRAQDNVTRVRVLFPFDSDSVMVGYRNNAAQLSVISSAVASLPSDAKVSVTSFSSPEGNLAYNRNLSLRRAKAMESYLTRINPSVNVELHPGEEAWTELRESVISDSRLEESVRDAVLEIIGSNDDLDVKEAKLAALPQYKTLYANYFKQLRYAVIELRIENSAKSEEAHANSEISENEDMAPAKAAGKTVKVVENGLPTVFYAVSEDFIRPSYMGNDASMKEIIRILRAGNVKSLVLEGSASPEGPAKGNERLSKDRVENLKNYILGMFPEMEDKIKVVSKETVSDATNEEEFASLRYARILSMEVEEEENADETEGDSKAEAQNVNENESEKDGNDGVDKNDNETAAEATVVSDTTGQNEQSAVDSSAVADYTKAPLFALTANGLYTAAGAIATGFHAVPIAVGYEVPIGKHWSIQSNYLITVPWQPWNNNADCAELMHWDLGARWYPGWSFTKPFKANQNTRVLEGWYASLSAGMGYYDFQRNGNGYQGEEALGSLGIGYSLCFNEHWSLNFGIGVGPMYTRYRYYEGRSNNEHLMYRYGGTFTYFGVTDAKVTLTYLFYYKKRNRK